MNSRILLFALGLAACIVFFNAQTAAAHGPGFGPGPGPSLSIGPRSVSVQLGPVGPPGFHGGPPRHRRPPFIVAPPPPPPIHRVGPYGPPLPPPRLCYHGPYGW